MVDSYPLCEKCGDDFQFSNEYRLLDGRILCRDCFNEIQKEWDNKGIKYFFQHVPGCAWPNTSHVFTFDTENELLENLVNCYGSDRRYSHCKSEKWSYFNGSYIMASCEDDGDWCIGYTNCDLHEIPELHSNR